MALNHRATAFAAGFHDLLSRPDVLASFERLGPLSWHPGSGFGTNLVFLYSDMPELARAVARRTPQAFAQTLTPHCVCTPNTDKTNLARLQSGLIQLLRSPKDTAKALAACPALEQLLGLPAMGWLAYEQLFNGQGGTCFDRCVCLMSPLLHEQGINRFDVGHGSIDAVYIESKRYGYYLERRVLSMPSEAPATLREELLAIDNLGLQGLVWFTQCDQRGSRFYEKVPASMFVESSSEWRKAKSL